jgi:hypothetical protein
MSKAGANSPRASVQPEPDDVGLDVAEGGDDTVLDVMAILGVGGDEAVDSCALTTGGRTSLARF